ncbi:MAG: tRNA pseudouridine(55) synthase TruB [Ruminococcaceae bacterium]|nr:tRNA pseudouridine(55) synthase TruB [Oscillospiraceae bacterium]
MEPSGVLLLNKPAGMTSHDCVNRIRRLYSTKKVGHTGTLDPMATGVLPILIGRAAKAADLLLSESKAYRAGLKLGLATDTEDTTGEILSRSDSIPDEAAVRKVCAAFTGEILQIPPMYSALKLDGQKLVDLARQGITVEREARPVTVHSLEVEATDDADSYILTVHCSKGTYIRTLCADIGKTLGCGGAMSSLCRLATGNFTLAECVTLDALADMDEAERLTLLRPVESLFADLPAVKLPPFFERLARSGNEIYQKKIGTQHPMGTQVRMMGADGFFALGEVREYPDGSAVKAVKLFML